MTLRSSLLFSRASGISLRGVSLRGPGSIAAGAAAVLALQLAPMSFAQHLVVGSPDTIIRRALPVSSTFDIVGACGGIVESMVSVGDITYIGDLTGRLYIHDPAFGVGYSFNTSNDASALATDGQTLFVGGSNGRIESYDLATEALLDVWRGPLGLHGMAIVGSELFAAGESGAVVRTSLAGDGTFTAFGDVGMPVAAMTVESGALVFGSATGLVKRMSLSSHQVTISFQVGTDLTALAVSLGHLMIGSDDGTLRRVDPMDGTVLDAHNVGSSISAIALTDGVAPALTYCYGLQCPCGNDDSLAGCENSTGRGARLTAAGTDSASADDLTLFVTGATPNSTAVVFMGADGASGALGDGLLCIGGSTGLQRFGVAQTSSFGALVLDGLGQHAAANFSAAFQITAGSDWHFQAWYRDGAGACGSGSNVTNSAIVQFTL